MSWSTVPAVTSTFSAIASVDNGYVDILYMVDGFLVEESIWTDVTPASPSWTVVS